MHWPLPKMNFGSVGKMPAVRKDESEQEYISRAVSMMMKNEGLSKEHALGKAYGMYRQHVKDKKKRKRTRARR